jgi:hypothetical protein
MKVGATLINMDSTPIAREGMEYLLKNSSEDCLVFLTDNGSTEPPEEVAEYPTVYIEQNDGVNLVWYKLKDFVEKNNIDILVCCHADLFVLEKDWDKKVKEAFESDKKLILAGFVGSWGIDANGGRSRFVNKQDAVLLNFAGGKYKNGKGSSYLAHGGKLEGVRAAACLDHCAMIYRTSMLDILKSFFPDPPPMHFEDRVLSVASNYYGHHCAIIGIQCDHISGAKSLGAPNYFETVKRWLSATGREHPKDGNYDYACYLAAEKQFLDKWREELSFIPFYVTEDYLIHPVKVKHKL